MRGESSNSSTFYAERQDNDPAQLTPAHYKVAGAFEAEDLTWSGGTVKVLTDDTSPVDAVRPMIGTAANGHTYPGAVVPFGLVQLSPDTGTMGWDHCSGYKYSDPAIIGFSHS